MPRADDARAARILAALEARIYREAGGTGGSRPSTPGSVAGEVEAALAARRALRRRKRGEALRARFVGPWRIVRPIGRGGMGSVFLATQRHVAGPPVALKLLDGAPAEDAARLGREVSALSRIRHPNIVPVLASGRDGDRSWLAMEFVPGPSLEEILNRPYLAPPWRARMAWFFDVAEALDAAHRAGIIHRDVKPGNILVAAGGRALLADFGVARFQSDAAATPVESGSAEPGTPAYMAPEQLLPGVYGNVGAQTDVHGLGIVLYEMLAGRRPFSGSTAAEAVVSRAAGPPPPPSTWNPEVPPDLDAAVLRALERRREERFGSVAAFAGAVRRALRPARAGQAARRVAAAALVPAAALLAGLSFLPGNPRSSPQARAESAIASSGGLAPARGAARLLLPATGRENVSGGHPDGAPAPGVPDSYGPAGRQGALLGAASGAGAAPPDRGVGSHGGPGRDGGSVLLAANTAPRSPGGRVAEGRPATPAPEPPVPPRATPKADDSIHGGAPLPRDTGLEDLWSPPIIAAAAPLSAEAPAPPFVHDPGRALANARVLAAESRLLDARGTLSPVVSEGIADGDSLLTWAFIHDLFADLLVATGDTTDAAVRHYVRSSQLFLLAGGGTEATWILDKAHDRGLTTDDVARETFFFQLFARFFQSQQSGGFGLAGSGTMTQTESLAAGAPE